MKKLKELLLFVLIMGASSVHASKIIIPMDDTQANHLKAYGITFWALENQIPAEWLLNYKGGSFLLPNLLEIQNQCIIRGVSHQIIADVQASTILDEIANPEVNMESVKLEVAPRVAVYSPAGKLPWRRLCSCASFDGRPSSRTVVLLDVTLWAPRSSDDPGGPAGSP